ncbi:MAG: hypothetical protein SangKO_073970 [Sandaracinaceae bacterium]
MLVLDRRRRLVAWPQRGVGQVWWGTGRGRLQWRRFPDLAVGAPGEDGAATDDGAVYVYLGGEGGYQPWRVILAVDLGLAAKPGLAVGSGLAALDLDLDGIDDLVIALGAPLPSKEGRIAFLRGGRAASQTPS